MKRYAVILIALTLTLPLAAQPYTAYVLLEPKTGTVLKAENANAPLPVASMTKMMTLLVAMDEIEEGRLKLDDMVTVSAKASKMGGSQVYLKQGAQFTVKDMLAATMIHSANDAAQVLAEKIGGTDTAFASMMNAKAKELGMTNSQFYTAHGLPARGGDPDDVMSALDAAKAGMALMRYPLMREYAAMATMPFESGTFKMMYNPNRLLGRFPGANGIKTGYHGKAGFCVTASATRGNMDLVAVVMGSKMKNDNFDTASKLLAEGFANYRMIEAVKKGARAQKPAVVKGGQIATVPVVAGANAVVLVKRENTTSLSTDVISTDVSAPVQKGQQVGFIVIKQGNQKIAQVPALADSEVDKQQWWKRWLP